MIEGTGIDIVETDRFRNAVKRWGDDFLKKIFTEKEISYSSRRRFSDQHFAARFATKEAVVHTTEMVQVLAGYGISREYTLEKYARDAKLLPIMDGTNETLLIKAASLL